MSRFKYNPGDKLGPYKIELIKRTRKGKSKGDWFGLFKCPNDGKIFESRIGSVSSGATKSCGCAKVQHCIEIGHKNAIDLVGKRSGKLTAIEYTGEKTKNGYYVWLCQCDCGGFKKVSSEDLVQEKVLSCGCLNSKGEAKIAKILQSLDIKYFNQYSFKDCKSDKNVVLRFDFYLPDYNTCIEYDGEQHFSYKNYGWNNKNNFELTQKRDAIKNQYCNDKNIGLIRVPYYDFNKINQEYLLDLINKK